MLEPRRQRESERAIIVALMKVAKDECEVWSCSSSSYSVSYGVCMRHVPSSNVMTGEEAICRFAAVLGQQQYRIRFVLFYYPFGYGCHLFDSHTKVTGGSTLCCPFKVGTIDLCNQAVIDLGLHIAINV